MSSLIATAVIVATMAYFVATTTKDREDFKRYWEGLYRTVSTTPNGDWTLAINGNFLYLEQRVIDASYFYVFAVDSENSLTAVPQPLGHPTDPATVEFDHATRSVTITVKTDNIYTITCKR